MKSRKVKIVDTTLRDGAQTPGVLFTSAEKFSIMKALSLAGVDEIEAGIPAMGELVCQDLKYMIKMAGSADILGWLRPAEYDIAMAKKAGLKRVHFSFPFSPLLRAVSEKKTYSLIEDMEKTVQSALKDFSFIGVGIQDALRTDLDEVVLFCRRAFNAGADRVRIADTVGSASPLKTYNFMTSLARQNIPLEKIEFHAHNDLGMAVANSVIAAEAGCGYLNTTVNGIGERAGNAALEEVVMAIKHNNCFYSSVKSTELADLSEIVVKASEIELSSIKAVVGKNIFNFESGIHAWGMNRNKRTYELFPPSETGRKRRSVIIGSHSGINSVIMFFNERNIRIEKDEARFILNKLDSVRRNRKGGVPEQDVLNLYSSLLKKKYSMKKVFRTTDQHQKR